MASSGHSCYNIFDQDKETYWSIKWLDQEQDRYNRGLLPWIEISFGRKITLSRLDMIRQAIHPSSNKLCSNFKELELSFSGDEGSTVQLSSENNNEWHTVPISPSIDTFLLRISDVTGNDILNNFCENIISELRVWGCTKDYIQHSTGTPSVLYPFSYE